MNRMNDKESKFIKLANHLYKNNWIHFTKLDPGWTNSYKGEDQIFAIIIRTLICNDNNSELFFRDINRYQGVKNHYTSKIELEEFLREKLTKYSIGTGKGSHRDNRHKSSTPRSIREYLDLTELNQNKFLVNIDNFHDLMTKLKKVHGIGPLTAFDISKRLYESGLISHLPQRFYLTGTGEIKGILELYPEVKIKKKLQQMGNQLMEKILEQTNIPVEVAYYGFEDLLCIYQKDKRYKKFLECKISVEQFFLYLLNKKCIKERGIC